MEDSAQRLSYKFQRLRERLRNAIVAGELAGKLPGERVLARQFRVNAKTLSKALTDLAAEGLLERTIGRGTFVRGGGAARSEHQDFVPEARPLGRWLVIADADCSDDPVCRAIGLENPDHEIVTDLAALRPSLVNQFAAVIDAHGVLPEATLRDLLLRCRRLVRIDAPPKTYSTHAVMIDRPLAAALLTRDLIRRGVRTIALVGDNASETFDVVRSTARRLDGSVTILTTRLDGVADLAGQADDLAFVCADAEEATRVRSRLTREGYAVPGDASVACVGIIDPSDPFACSGYAITAGQVAQTIAQLIAEPQLSRPTTLWLVGAYVDRCTVRGDAECPDAVGAEQA